MAMSIFEESEEKKGGKKRGWEITWERSETKREHWGKRKRGKKNPGTFISASTLIQRWN